MPTIDETLSLIQTELTHVQDGLITSDECMNRVISHTLAFLDPRDPEMLQRNIDAAENSEVQ